MNSIIKITASCVLAFGLFPSFAQNVADTLEFSRAASQSPAAMLKGRSSGVRVSYRDGSPNGMLNTNIRGVNVMRGDSQPLWIVDGVMLSTGLNQNLSAFWQKGGYTTKGDAIPDYSELSYSTALNNMAFINPYDIVSIEVIKDMSAAAIYGSQGANGVIIVTTGGKGKTDRNINAAVNMGIDWGNRSGDALRPALSGNYTVGVNGSAGNVSYNVSGFFRNTNGIVPRTGSNYGGLNVALETKANSVVWFGMNALLGAGVMHNTAGVTYLGKPSTMMVSRYPTRFTGDSISGWLEDYDDDAEDYHAAASLWMRINFTPNLYLKLNGGADFNNNTRRIWYGNGTSFGAKVNGAASIMSSTLFNYNGKLSLCYNRYLGGKHHISTDLSADAVGSRNRFGVMNGTTFDLHYLRARGLSAMTSRASAHKFSRDYVIAGVYGKLSYEYDGYFKLDALYRADFSPKYTKAKHMGYPSAEAELNLHKLICPAQTVLSSFALAGGYGSAGREEYVPYELVGNYLRSYPSVEAGTENFYDGLSRIKSSEWNIGFKMGFLAGRISLDAKYYDKKTSDSFYIYNFGKKTELYTIWASKAKIDYTTVGELSNRGFEVDFNADIIRTAQLKWSLFANLAYNVNRAEKVEYADFAGIDLGRNIFLNIFSEGHSVGSLLGYEDAPGGGFVDRNLDGSITDVDKVVLGNTIPLVSGGLGTTLSTHGVTIDLLFDGAAGHKVANVNKMIAQGRTKLSSNYVEKADFLRLSRLSAAYEIPLKTNIVKSLSVNVSALNLFTLSSYSGWNPDVNCFGNQVASYGVDYGSFPLVRTVLIGVSCKF